MNKKTEVVKDLLINGETIEPNGRSKFICECPFCKTDVYIQKWSFWTTGKRCDCGAILRGSIAVMK